MIQAGLASVTFRKLPPKDVIGLVKQAGLHGIEWGADIHVPPGDTAKACEVRRMTTDEGLTIAAYGSYYRIGCQANGTDDFKKVLESAVELQAPTIRVWAGNKASKDVNETWWENIINESRTIADMAGKNGISISYEYHRNTLTDTNETALRLLKSVNHQNIYTYWQPLSEYDFHSRAEGLAMIKPKLTNLHVFHWLSDTRVPLKLGSSDWLEYSKIAADDQNHYALLEFVMNDSERQFLEDAEVLKATIMKLSIFDPTRDFQWSGLKLREWPFQDFLRVVAEPLRKYRRCRAT